jgi:CheY-like chemotaxis protein
VGQGTVVTLLLPAGATAAPEAVVRPNPSPATSASRPRLLVMDDDIDLLDLERRILTKAGYDVTTASHGEAAVEAFARSQDEGRPYSCVVLDLTIVGGMGGLETLGRIRALDARTRAVVCSGYSRDPVMADPRAHGFDGMVPKPFAPTQLLDEVRLVVDVADGRPA